MGWTAGGLCVWLPVAGCRAGRGLTAWLMAVAVARLVSVPSYLPAHLPLRAVCCRTRRGVSSSTAIYLHPRHLCLHCNHPCCPTSTAVGADSVGADLVPSSQQDIPNTPRAR